VRKGSQEQLFENTILIDKKDADFDKIQFDQIPSSQTNNQA